MSIWTPGTEKAYPLGMDWRTAATIGLITDCARVATLGTNTDVDTLTDPEDVWSGAAIGIINGIDHKLVQIPQTAVATEVVSDNANDTSAGTGLRTLLVGYLDLNYDSKSVTITLNGTTPVALPENIIAINSMVRLTAGTFKGNNIGNISLRDVGGGGATYGYMAAGHGFHRSSLYTVPNGYTLLLYSEFFSVIQNDKIDKWAVFSLPIMNTTGAVARALQFAISSISPYRHEADNLPVNTVAQKNSAWVTCDSVTEDNTDVTAGFVGFLIKNTRLIVGN
jgi:hypothetical protein